MCTYVYNVHQGGDLLEWLDGDFRVVVIWGLDYLSYCAPI
jgi:hypothetical protein